MTTRWIGVWLAGLVAMGGAARAYDYPIAIQRGNGVANVFAKLSSGQPATIAYIGGSVTQMTGWRDNVTNWFKSVYPGKITEVNAGWGGTGSLIGAMRYNRDVLPSNPDLVFIEFAVNDLPEDPLAFVERNSEGMPRQAWAANSYADICFIETLASYILPPYLSGYYPTTVQAHYAVCDGYGIPSVNVGWRLYQVAQANGVDYTTYLPDGTHPNSTGSQIYSDAVIAYLAGERTRGGAWTAHTTPSALTDFPVTGGTITDMVTASPLPGGWSAHYNEYGVTSFVQSSTVDSTISIQFTGPEAAAKVIIAPDSGTGDGLAYSVDGSAYQPANQGVNGYTYIWAFPIAKTLTNSTHTATFKVNSGVARIINLEAATTGTGSGGMTGDVPTGTNLAPQSSSCQSDSSYNADYTCSKAIDGVISGTSKWCSAGTSPPHWLALDLGQTRTVNGFIVRHAGAAGELTSYNTKSFSIQSASSMSGPWSDETVVDNTAQANVTYRSYVTPKSLRYVRLYITNAGIDNYARIPEFEVWCSTDDTTPPSISNIIPSPACVKTGSSVSVTATVTDDVSISQSGISLLMPTNLLTNPSFESGFTGWTNTSPIPYSVGNNYPTPGTAKDGSNWVGSSCAWGSGAKTPELRQVVSVTPGSRYWLSVWVCTDGSPNACSAYLQWKDGAATADGQCTTIASFPTNTSGGWKQLCGVVQPTGSQITCCLRLSWDCSTNGGGGNFDLAELRLATTPNTYADGTATWPSVLVTGGCAFAVYARDDAGNASLATSTVPVTIDDAPPNDFTPSAVPSGWTNANVSVSFSTTDSGCSGMSHYEIAIDGGGYTTQTSPYTMTQAGSHTVHVKAVDNAGNYRIKDVSTSIDTSAPTTPVVTDDGVYTTNSGQLHASWTSADPESGIAEYQYAIGTTSGGTDVAGWTSTATTASATRTGLALAYDQPYYFSVRARNNANTWSESGNSDGITVARAVSTVSEAKSYADGSAVQLADKLVSARIGSAFWIEESGRAGIRVNDTAPVTAGARMTVTGKLATDQGDRYMDQAVASQNGALTAPAAVGLTNRALGGGSASAYTPGVKDGVGLNNLGLYARVWGRVTQLGSDYFYIDDGAGLLDGSVTGATANVGVRVLAAPGTLLPGDFAVVTGVSSAFDVSGQHPRAILPVAGGVLKL